jgi:hypothetical protein
MTEKKTTYHFREYTLRPATEADRDLATTWTAADPWHANTTPPDFWLDQAIGLESYILEDAEGPVFFFRMTRAVRLDIQFPPEDPHDDMRKRVRDGLREGFGWLAAVLALSGVHQVIFKSENPELIRSAEKRLGFVPSPGEFVHDFVARKAAVEIKREEASDVRSHGDSAKFATTTG